MSEKLFLDAVIDPLAATVIVEGEGNERTARFDIAGVPRVDKLLVGKRASEVPTIVTRLCGLCPVTHHLAGMRALDQLVGSSDSMSEQAVQLRRLLHAGSVLDTLAPRLLPDHGLEIRKFAKLVLRAAGCPGHFPDVAIPGGVHAHADADEVKRAAEGVSTIRSLLPSQPVEPVEQHPPKLADLFACDADGAADPLGERIAARFEGELHLFPAHDFYEHVREQHPGAITPRPQVLIDGHWRDYRVGPVARFPHLSARDAQFALVRSVLDDIEKLLQVPELLAEPVVVDNSLRDGTATGIVDGPRGLLVHRYTVEDGNLSDCQILSPTAQNEGWLARMLTEASTSAEMEHAIRSADPCLPCTSAPEGAMNINIERK